MGDGAAVRMPAEHGAAARGRDSGAAPAAQKRRARLQRWLPKTMTGLVAAGCLLAASPLLVAILISGIVMQQQAERSEALVAEALRLERLGAQLQKELEDLERGGLQYIALEDKGLLPVIERRRGAAEETLRQIDSERFPPSVREHTHRIAAGLAEVATTWAPETADAATLARAMELTHALGGEVDAVVAAGRVAIDERMRELQQQTSEARRMTRVLAMLLVPLSALLAWGFSLAVTRPLKALRARIVALGTSDYGRPIEIPYPSEMARVGEKLDWLRRRLAVLEADKDRFLRHVSHELKTPLASLREGTGLLIEGSLGPLNERQAEVLQILAESGEELETQIRNLLAYAEWRSGQRQPDLEWFAARAMIDEVLAAQRLPMTKRRLQAVVQADGELRLHGQRTRLKVALDNLLSNAIKHTPAGSAIEIVAERRQGRCQLSVRDYGRGIPPGERQRLLEPFVRGTEEEEYGVRGTGVGLSIVVETMNAHGGELDVQDAQPGARMVMRWPCPLADI